MRGRRRKGEKGVSGGGDRGFRKQIFYQDAELREAEITECFEQNKTSILLFLSSIYSNLSMHDKMF